MKIGIVIPTYNEELNIYELLRKIEKNLSNYKDYKIVIVDDSLNKNIEKKIVSFQNSTKYIHRGKKLGRGSAVLEGIKYLVNKSYFDVIIEMDADLSHDPEELKEKIDIFQKQKCDLLISSRYTKDSKIINWSLKRKILSFLANKLARFLLRVEVSDYTNGFRFYSNEAAIHIINNCGKIGDGFIILSEILLELSCNNFKVIETKTIFRNRTKGTSSVNFKLIFFSIIGLFKLFKIKILKY